MKAPPNISIRPADWQADREILNAQIQALPFYLRHGFQPEGEEFLDAGIPHRRMGRDL